MTKRDERKARFYWFATYRGCGCCVDAQRKKDLPIACPKHGTSAYLLWKRTRTQVGLDDKP